MTEKYENVKEMHGTVVWDTPVQNKNISENLYFTWWYDAKAEIVLFNDSCSLVCLFMYYLVYVLTLASCLVSSGKSP